MHPNAELVQRFYTAFQVHDADAMGRCYHPDVTFSDEVFPSLRGATARAMWTMLLARAASLRLIVDGIDADERTGRAHWVATYPFSKTGRLVVNDVHATFEFADGLIVRHVDQFDFYAWSRMALGPVGVLFGWTPLLRHAVQRQAKEALDSWIAAHQE